MEHYTNISKFIEEGNYESAYKMLHQFIKENLKAAKQLNLTKENSLVYNDFDNKGNIQSNQSSGYNPDVKDIVLTESSYPSYPWSKEYALFFQIGKSSRKDYQEAVLYIYEKAKDGLLVLDNNQDIN